VRGAINCSEWRFHVVGDAGLLLLEEFDLELGSLVVGGGFGIGHGD